MEFLFDQGHSEAEAQGGESVEAHRGVAWQQLGQLLASAVIAVVTTERESFV